MAGTTHFIHDRLLGHVPNPGFRGSGFGGSFHTIDSNGIRFSGARPASSDGAILTVGDSFTYGDEVLDEESWPAQLQRLVGRPVLNGGVTGYGFDQIVLRTEQLAGLHKPSLIIVSFIADDLRRTEMRRMWWRDKPWFAIEGDRLVLKGVPVPNRAILPLEVRRRMDSVLVDFPPVLQTLVGYHVRVHRAGRGLAIGQRLTERLAALQAERAARIVVVAQYPPVVWANTTIANEQRRQTQTILDSAAACGLATLDTFPRLAAEPKPQAFYGFSHMNARGNLMIASLLSATLPSLLKLP
ncbi:MAG: SGNH/GDSL hydrolase family protein [Reyranella sp.]|uniref:SGNH/GDSL hydrolase family protein n=1 Tax=Reyranella sp. TaxID=1929291 RepID=UPI003D0D8D92